VKDALAFLIASLQLFGVAALLMCTAGNALAGEWGNAAVALATATLLVTR
jgi:energy-converting hydrogenase Eha subunit H